MKIEINGLNYYKPIDFIHITDNQYKITIFDKLYEYEDNINLQVVPHYNGETSHKSQDEIVFDGDLKREAKLQTIILEDGHEYLYNMFITQNDEIVSTHYGKMIVNNGIVNSEIQFISDVETIQNDTTRNNSTQSTSHNHSIYENENCTPNSNANTNNSRTTATRIYSDKDVYGRIGASTDIDYYKITFTRSGTANFWLGDIYKNVNRNLYCDYDLYVYNNNGSLLWSSTNSGQSQELISSKQVSATTYYVKVVSKNSSSYVWDYYYFLRVRLVSDSASSGFTWPTKDETINWCFGCTEYSKPCPAFPNGLPFHRGWDIRGTNANPVVATANGIVGTVYNTTQHSSYGKAVFINHQNNPISTGAGDDNWSTRYAHMCEVLVNVGDTVQRGKILGYIGTTVQSSGEHLHYEILDKYGAIVSPSKYFGSQYCTGCGKYTSTNSGNNCCALHSTNNIQPIKYGFNIDTCISDQYLYENSVLFYINEDFILDLNAIRDMELSELEKYGINSNVLNLVATEITQEKMDTRLSIYTESMYRKIK